MRVEDDATPLVYPEVLLDERAVLLRQEAVCEADEAVGGRHGGSQSQIRGSGAEGMGAKLTLGMSGE